MSALLKRLLARRLAQRALEGYARVAKTREQFRDLVSERARKGDLDAIYESIVLPSQERARRYVEKG